MLQHIIIENFRALQRVDVALKPLTVLIGPNDSGKTSFLDAVFALAAASGFQSTDHWRFEKIEIKITGITEDGPVILSSRGGVSNSQGHARHLHPPQKFNLPLTGVPMLSEGYPDSSGANILSPSGEGVPALLDYFLRRDRDRFYRVVDTLRDHIPGLEDLEIGTPHPGKRSIDLRIERGLRLQGDRASAGVRLLIFFVALAFHPSPPKIILLEEPESGVHPGRLTEVMKLLRAVTRGSYGPASQVILTTHSPRLLDEVDLDQDQLLIFRRREDGARTAERADKDRLSVFLDEFMLGEVWQNESEEGLIPR